MIFKIQIFSNGGPYKVFTKIETEYYNKTRVYMSKKYCLFRTVYQANPEVMKMVIIRMMKIKHQMLMIRNIFSCKFSRILAETAGADINYRCKNCRNCKPCKEYYNTEIMSIRQKVYIYIYKGIKVHYE